MARRSRKQVPGAMVLYPSSYARTRQYPKHRETKETRGKGEDAESRAGRCAQCGALFKDVSAIAECWNCTSDNIEGRRL